MQQIMLAKMKLSEWLAYLEQESSEEKIELGLTRIKTAAQRLQLLKPLPTVITVAGTNGKGSTVALLEAIYHAANYRVASYTSPHLFRINERIRINSKPIADDALCLAFAAIESAREGLFLTNFEILTLAALWHFKSLSLDVIILEVGLGGRLDATNIIDSDLAIITTIDFDHQAYLGDTLEKIGYEKAGILRPHQPCIYADEEVPQSIVKQVALLNANMHYYQKDYQIEENEQEWLFSHAGEVKNLPLPSLGLKSASAAIMASKCLQKVLPVTLEHLSKAMQQVSLPGRLELQKGDIPILYDVSHNPQGVRLLAEYIASLSLSGKVHAIFSALSDKPLLALINSLKGCVHRWYPAQLNTKRAASMEALTQAFEEAQVEWESCYTSASLALEAAKRQAKSADLIVVFGSFYTVAAIRRDENGN